MMNLSIRHFLKPTLVFLRRATFVLLVIVTACTPSTSTPTTTPTPGGTPTATLPTAAETRVKAPDPQAVAQAWLDAWGKDDYETMYGMLTNVSRDALTKEKFTNRYTDVAINLTLKKLQSQILQALVLSPRSAQVAFEVTFETNMVGVLKRENTMNLSLENNSWKVQWDDALIMPELKGGNRLTIEIKVPARGDIYDRTGQPIVARAEAVALGIYPDNIESSKEKRMLDELSALTGKPAAWIKALYTKSQPGAYIPVGEAPKQAVDERMTTLQSFGNALQISSFSGRYYYDQGMAAHAVGYVQAIPPEELTKYLRMGYRSDEKIGKSGLEKWGQDYLTGQRGVTLYLTDANGSNLNKLAQIDAKPAQSVYTTLDKNLQIVAQKAIAGFRGAVVVMERDTGRVLAMASWPTFDPNAFETSNFNWSYEAQALNDNNKPLLNRATQGLYPLGSTFKTITMSAALESGLYTKDTTYDCQYVFKKTGIPLYDWTYDHKVPASGMLTLPEGLMRSCNTYFYDIGYNLYGEKGEKPVTDMARGFGMGSPTGIGQVAEDSGNMPYPTSQDDAVQMAIGQGAILGTPLQVADFMSAIGNGGTLYRPQLVEKITSPDGQVTYSFKPEVRGKLPISPENLRILQDAMRSVVENPRGTGNYFMTGLTIPVSGKTGTATNSTGNSHAWFSGYTSANQPDKPDLAISVLCENAGEGSEIALPIFRRMVETYFFGKPITTYWWESNFYITRTPQPTATPKP